MSGFREPEVARRAQRAELWAELEEIREEQRRLEALKQRAHELERELGLEPRSATRPWYRRHTGLAVGLLLGAATAVGYSELTRTAPLPTPENELRHVDWSRVGP